MSNFSLPHVGLTPAAEVSALAVVLVLLLGAAVVIVMRKRRNPRERERRRRLAVNRCGRFGDGTVVDCQEDVLYYNYSLCGVDYTASQDVSTLREYLHGDLASCIGPVTLKYSSRNPANSILLCEEWSGLRGHTASGVPGACHAASAGATG